MATLQTPAKDEWEGILDADENIIWQGRPDPGFELRPRQIFPAVFGMFFAGFALLWMIGAAFAGGLFWTFGLLHFSAGLAVIWGAMFYPSFARRRTWYTLTGKRAFIASDMPLVGRRLTSYPINKQTLLDFNDGKPPSVIFASKTVKSDDSSYQREIGFERITDAREVLAKMRAIQNGDITT